MKEPINAKGEHMIENTPGGDGAADMRGALAVGRRNSERSGLVENGNGNGNGNDNGNSNSKSKSNDNSNASRSRDRPPSISVSTRGVGGDTGRSKTASKNPTPQTATFATADSSRSRPARGTLDHPITKRSHKKGAGIAAQMAAAAAAAHNDDEGSSIHDGDGEGAGDGDADADEDEERGDEEPRYCYCNEVSYGEMVGCDADDCPREWFHLDCVGLSRAPAKNGEFYLPVYPGGVCKEDAWLTVRK